ncbi:MAG: hypothetical protein E7390_01240 [Ruminococcaceae bacterium]|nr:hypothetical protein [Oscillospiraceae bacterium]
MSDAGGKAVDGPAKLPDYYSEGSGDLMKEWILPLAAVLFLTGCGAEEAVPEPTAAAAAAVEGWGYRRMENARPEFTAGQMEAMATYDCIYMGKEDEGIYLTFDEGYENGYTGAILDTLKEKEVKAAFFITGPYLEQHEDLVRRMVEEGHIVGNHTVNHPSLPTVASDTKLREELTGLTQAFQEKFGAQMRYLRPPKGEYNDRTLRMTKEMGYTNVFWSFAYQDWEQNVFRGKEYAYEKVMNGLHGGAVLLLHAVSKDNAEALGDIIDGARAKGYVFRSLDAYVREE